MGSGSAIARGTSRSTCAACWKRPLSNTTPPSRTPTRWVTCCEPLKSTAAASRLQDRKRYSVRPMVAANIGEIDPLSQQSYDKILKSHLDDYRRGRLGRIESGVFVKNGVERPYGHILPADLKWLNILEPFRSEVMQYQIANSLRLHRYFHHLNSSQAFAFNLFIPLSQHAPQKLATVLTAIPLGPQNSPVAGGPAGGKERTHPTVCRRPRRGLDLGVAGLNPVAIPQNTTELRIWSCWSPSQSRRLPRDRPFRSQPRARPARTQVDWLAPPSSAQHSPGASAVLIPISPDAVLQQ
jgi:hypothetical protein